MNDSNLTDEEMKEPVNIFEDCPELFRAAATIFIKKINAICSKYSVHDECYTNCPLYGDNCGLTRHGTYEEIREILRILDEFEEEPQPVCKCGYAFNNDDYKFCPRCGAEKP